MTTKKSGSQKTCHDGKKHVDNTPRRRCRRATEPCFTAITQNSTYLKSSIRGTTSDRNKMVFVLMASCPIHLFSGELAQQLQMFTFIQGFTKALSMKPFCENSSEYIGVQLMFRLVSSRSGNLPTEFRHSGHVAFSLDGWLLRRTGCFFLLPILLLLQAVFSEHILKSSPSSVRDKVQASTKICINGQFS